MKLEQGLKENKDKHKERTGRKHRRKQLIRAGRKG